MFFFLSGYVSRQSGGWLARVGAVPRIGEGLYLRWVFGGLPRREVAYEQYGRAIRADRQVDSKVSSR